MGLLPPVVAVLEGDISHFISKMSEAKKEMDAVDKKGEAVAGRLRTGISTGLIGAGTAFTAVGAIGVEQSDKIEKAQVTLQQAIENAGGSWDAYSGKIDAAIKKGEDYGHTADDTQNALARLVIATQDPAKALHDLTLVEQVAALMHLSLADASKQVELAEQGKGRLFAQLGIAIPKNTDATKELTAAEKAHQGAVDALAKAQRQLSELEARDAGVKKLSVAQQQALKNAHDAVSAAQMKEKSTAGDLVLAQSAVSDAHDRVADAVAKLTQRTKGIAEAQADTFGGKLDAVKARVSDFAGVLGGKVGPALIAAGPLMMGIGGIMQMTFIPAVAKGTIAMIGKTASTIADIGVMVLWKAAGLAGAAATGIMTAAQWALNIALDANPIGLVVIAIAALVGGFILAYTHIKPFRDFVNFLWKELQVAFHWIAEMIHPAIDALGKIMGRVIDIALTPFKLEFMLIKDGVELAFSAFNKFVDFLKGRFTDAINAVSGPIKAVGGALNSINPFAKHSPSLVENVEEGTRQIAGHYEALRGRIQASLQGALSLGGTSLGPVSIPALVAPAIRGSAEGGVVVQVTVQGPVLNWNQTAEALVEPVRAALLRRKRSVGSLGLA